MDKKVITQRLEETPIVLPKSAFWEVFKRFGRDEFIALIINSGSTAAINFFVNSDWLTTLVGPVSRRIKDGILAVTGPVTEKVGFFPAHFKEAWTNYRKTPKDKRDPLSTYFTRAVKSVQRVCLKT